MSAKGMNSMWAIRVLTGQQAGQVFPLRSGPTILGRAPSCQIKILSPNISKEHVKIEVFEGRTLISDLGSRNGTFVNGTQVRSAVLKAGDRIGLNDIVIEFGALKSFQQTAPSLSARPHSSGALAMQLEPEQQAAYDHRPRRPAQPANLLQHIEEYLNRVVMPAVFHLGEILEFKWLLGLFIAAFILLVTSLSTVPLIRILRDSVEQTSQQHALTIAATLAKVNEAAVRDGLYTAINMSTAHRFGVKRAQIILSMDGKIIAPASEAESYTDIPTAHEARKINRESVHQISSGTVVATYPIEAYNPDTGSRSVMAYSVVEYDMSSLAVDDSKTISLFISTMFIALLFGGILFYLLYRIIEHPIDSLNQQLDGALRERRDDLRSTFIFPPLQKLTSNINSALTRSATAGPSTSPSAVEYDRRLEINHLVEMVGFAAVIVSARDRIVAAVNQGFEERTRLNPAQILHQPLNTITDQALKLSLTDLIDQLEQKPDEVVSNQLEFGGQNYQIMAQGIFGSLAVAYILIILVPSGGEA
jgi:hypothetical protein